MTSSFKSISSFLLHRFSLIIIYNYATKEVCQPWINQFFIIRYPMAISGRSEVKITTGLEFLKDVCIDTHFVDRSRFIRMAQVIATNPTCIGFKHLRRYSDSCNRWIKGGGYRFRAYYSH